MDYLEAINLSLSCKCETPRINCENVEERKKLFGKIENADGVKGFKARRENLDIYLFGIYCEKPFDLYLTCP